MQQFYTPEATSHSPFSLPFSLSLLAMLALSSTRPGSVGACSRCVASQSLTESKKQRRSKTNMKIIRLKSQAESPHQEQNQHDTPTILLRAWGPGLFLWQKAAVHTGKMFLASNTLAEADTHFEFMVITGRNITVFGQN